MGCYGSLRIALLDGFLVYPDIKDMHTYSIRSPTLRRFCFSMYWKKSFFLRSSMASTLSLEFKLWAEGFELKHIQSIVVKVGDIIGQFDVDRMLESLSSTSQAELVDLFQT
jgi:hypothetical protein